MSAQPIYYALNGGLDQESAAIAVPPGRAIAVLNHESVSRGYQRTQGYERYDGRPRPSDATYYELTFTAGATAFVVGQTIEGLASGATARVLAVPALYSGAWNGTGAGSLVVHLITGAFQIGEQIAVAATPRATLATLPERGLGTGSDVERGYLAAAQDHARSLIAKVPAFGGTGPVLGVLWFAGRLHAWRANKTIVQKVFLSHSSPNGWVAADLGKELIFTSGGPVQILTGQSVVGATSGATADVRKIVVNAGTDWAAGTASGAMILDNIVGNFVAENLNVGANLNVATIAGNAFVTDWSGTDSDESRFQFDIFNFYGSTGTERAYGVNGHHPAFEFDGESVISISTGMVPDNPKLVAAHKNHLFLAFPGGSLQHSDLGEPRSYTAVLGAAELGLGHEITNLIPNATSALLITTDKSLSMLTGNDSSDWILDGISDEAGGKWGTAQRIGQIIYVDERGVRSVSASQQYGNFKVGTYTSLIQKELDAKRKRGAVPVASAIVKAKDQYLLFYSDGSGISIYFGRKNPEAMLFEYPFVVTCCHIAEVEGYERIFVGAKDGYVYELNVGTSFDGAEIEAYLQMPFGHQGAPRVNKRYHKAIAELIAGPETELAMVAEFDYGAGLQPFAHSEEFFLRGGGGLWGLSNWAEFYWDSPTVAQAESYIHGQGANMGLTIFSRSSSMESYILQGVTVTFSPRGMKR